MLSYHKNNNNIILIIIILIDFDTKGSDLSGKSSRIGWFDRISPTTHNLQTIVFKQ